MTILIVDDENGFVTNIARSIKTRWAIRYATTVDEAKKIIRHHKTSVNRLEMVIIANKVTLPYDEDVPFYYINRKDKRPYIPLYDIEKLLLNTIVEDGFKTKTFVNPKDLD
jgi:hypothetical protein